jgi:hypothetical protein
MVFVKLVTPNKPSNQDRSNGHVICKRDQCYLGLPDDSRHFIFNVLSDSMTLMKQ